MGREWDGFYANLFLSKTLRALSLEANRYPRGSYTMACARGLGQKGVRGESCVKGGRNRSCPPTYGNKNQLGYKHPRDMGHAYDHTALRRHATNNPLCFFECVWGLTRGRIVKDKTYVFKKCMLMFLENVCSCFQKYCLVFLDIDVDF